MCINFVLPLPIFPYHSLKHNYFPIYRLISISELRNNVPNGRYVIAKHNTTEHLNETCNYFLFPVLLAWQEIAKTNCHHNSRAPIKSIGILNVPLFILNTCPHHPVVFRLNLSHGE